MVRPVFAFLGDVVTAADLSGTCGTCDARSVGWAGQVIREGRLRWEEAWECRTCGWVSCDGGWEPAPSWVREAVLAQHGPSVLRAAGRGGGVLKLFRDVLGLSLEEAGEAVRALRGDGFRCTSVEADCLAGLLREAGVEEVKVG